MKKLCLLLFIISFYSCERIFNDGINTPLDNFDLFFEYLKSDYAYRDAFPFSVDELKAKYQDQMEANPSESQLAFTIVKVEQDLLDPHFQPSSEIYSNTNQNSVNYFSLRPEEERDFRPPILLEIEQLGVSAFFYWGVLKEDPTIGYIYVTALVGAIGGTGRLTNNPDREQINPILEELNRLGVTRMIVDIRSGAGGSSYNGQYIANRFADKTATYLIEEYLIDDGEIEQLDFQVSPQGEIGFRTGKIALLTNNLTCSGGELLTLAMLQRGSLVHIGTPTRGCAGSIVERDLYNGWNFVLTSSKTFGPNKEEYFQSGIRPEIIVKNPSDYGINTLEDELIKRAVIELNR